MIVEELKTQAVGKVTPVFHRIMVAIDFSEASRRALCVADSLAVNDHVRIAAVHVLSPDWRYEMLENPPEIDLEHNDAQERLQKFVGGIGAARKAETILVKRGPLAPTLLAIAGESGADLIVMGTRGRGGLQKIALGSVAEEVLRVAACPVITVGPKANMPTAATEPGFHTILFATDFGKGSAKALPLVLELARQHQSKLILLHMIPPMPVTSTSLSAYAPSNAAADELQEWEGSSRKRSLQQLKEWMPSETGLAQDPEYIVGTDFFPEGVLTAASNFKADLIVMGANRTGSARVAAHVPWTAVHEVVGNAPCPVLTVAV